MMADLSGRLRFFPGRAAPNIVSTRPALVERLVVGQPAERAAPRIAALHALCGMAQRATAQAAIDAALGRSTTALARAQRRAELRRDTVRDHVCRIWLDWPRLLALAPAATPDWRACPALTPGTAEPERLRAWVEAVVLGEPITPWLAAWRDNPAQALLRWTARGERDPGHSATWPAHCLAACREDARRMIAPPMALSAHADHDSLRALAAQLAADTGFALAPTWQGAPRETGSWTRLADLDRHIDTRIDNIWLRLGARIAALAALAAGEGAEFDDAEHGAIELCAGAAIAWSETARGVLLHWTRLRDTPAGACVAAYRLVAPTDWNFHPHGVAAQALAQLDGADAGAATRGADLIAAAWDPCVIHEVVVGADSADSADGARVRAAMPETSHA